MCDYQLIKKEKPMKSFFQSVKNVLVTLIAISLMIVMMDMFFSAGQKELCGRLYEQKVDHETMGLYPGFFISESDQKVCREIGYSL